jgi:hypothetical protein
MELLDELSDYRVLERRKEWREQSKNSITAVKEIAFHSAQEKEERKRWL